MHFQRPEEKTVGQVAEEAGCLQIREGTVLSIKRDIGSNRKVNIDGKQYHTARDYPAMILQKLKADAKVIWGKPFHRLFITVPAYFSDAQRQATRMPVKSQVEVLRIINEPTAAALAYGLDKEKDQKILVFDLGGGTI